MRMFGKKKEMKDAPPVKDTPPEPWRTYYSTNPRAVPRRDLFKADREAYAKVEIMKAGSGYLAQIMGPPVGKVTGAVSYQANASSASGGSWVNNYQNTWGEDSISYTSSRVDVGDLIRQAVEEASKDFKLTVETLQEQIDELQEQINELQEDME